MREILFRGKRIDNGEWVYGMPLESKFGCTYMLTKQGGLNADFIYSRYTILDKKDSIPVVSESIGQFTGLLDKSGNEIFEGDYLESAHGNTFLIDFRKGSFVLIHEPKCGAERDGTNEIPWDYLHEAINVYELEIIGNIHEENK